MSKGDLRALYTVSEVAELLGVSRHVVSRWLDRGSLPHVLLGGKRWVPLAGLRAQGLVWDSLLLTRRMREDAAEVRVSRVRRGD